MKLADRRHRLKSAPSPPARGRGLKQRGGQRVGQRAEVAPRAGAWIETSKVVTL